MFVSFDGLFAQTWSITENLVRLTGKGDSAKMMGRKSMNSRERGVNYGLTFAELLSQDVGIYKMFTVIASLL